MRKATFAGQFYPSDKKEILFMLDNLLKEKKGKAKGIIVPHAGYTFSGKTAGLAYSELKDFDLAVIIGTNHNSSSQCVSLEDFKTPLGIAKNAEETAKLGIKEDETVHQNEHSIGVQIPFIQKLNPEAEIIPILASQNKKENKELAEKIYNTVRRPFIFVISSDFTHAGLSYGYPISYERAEQTDRQAIKKIEELNSEEFFDIARKTTICGRNAILVGIELAKYLRLKPKLLDFSSSASISGKQNFVNYASLVFE